MTCNLGREGIMFCTQCGSRNEEGSAFCTECGSPLKTDRQATQVMQESGPQATQRFDLQQTQVMDASDVRQESVAYVAPHDTSPFQKVPEGNGGYVQDPPTARNSKKSLYIIIGVAVAVIVVVALCVAFVPGACSKDSNKDAASETQSSQAISNAEKTEHVVVLETNGATTYEQLHVKAGDVVTSPVDPSRPGYSFGGWYLDSACTKPVSFPYTVKQDDPATLVIYAKWVDANPTVSSSSDIFPQSSSAYLTDSDLFGLDKDQVQRAINEIYARNGYIFQSSQTEKSYFESQPWYHGTETNMDAVRAKFNDYERANEKKLAEYRDHLS